MTQFHAVLMETLGRHLGLGKSRPVTLVVLICGLVQSRTVNLSHLAVHLSGPARPSRSTGGCRASSSSYGSTRRWRHGLWCTCPTWAPQVFSAQSHQLKARIMLADLHQLSVNFTVPIRAPWLPHDLKSLLPMPLLRNQPLLAAIPCRIKIRTRAPCSAGILPPGARTTPRRWVYP